MTNPFSLLGSIVQSLRKPDYFEGAPVDYDIDNHFQYCEASLPVADGLSQRIREAVGATSAPAEPTPEM